MLARSMLSFRMRMTRGGGLRLSSRFSLSLSGLNLVGVGG